MTVPELEQIPPNPPLIKGGEGVAPDLAETLSWLDYCLGETQAAMEAVKAAAVDTEGMTCRKYHDMCETAAKITTLRWRAAQWGKR